MVTCASWVKTKGNWIEERHKVFDTIYCSGSGAINFITTARLFNDGYGIYTSLQKSVLQNLDLLSKFLAIESYNADSILNKWGAGFELVYFSGGKIL